MSAYIYVVDTPYYSITESSGRFVIRDVPPGIYTLHVWHESGEKTTQRVTLAAGGAPLSLVLTRQ